MQPEITHFNPKILFIALNVGSTTYHCQFDYDDTFESSVVSNITRK